MGERGTRLPAMPWGEPGWSEGIAPVDRPAAGAAATYDRLARCYDVVAGPFEARAHAAGRQLLALRRGERVLEVGCGTGRDAAAMAREVGPAGSVVGVDLSPGMLAKARRHTATAWPVGPPSLVLADGRRLPLPDASFDAVSMAFTLELMGTDDLLVVLAEARRVLRPGGRLSVVSLDQADPAPPVARAYLWARDRVPRLLDCRPIPVRQLLRHAGFAIGATRPLRLAGMPALAVVATPTLLDAWLFDLDGVLTDTASVHVAAWKATFDDELRARAERSGEPYRPFDPVADYQAHVDGRPRYDGVRAFLASRGIHPPEGDRSDPPEAGTVCGIGNRKNAALRAALARDGVSVFDDAVTLLDAVQAAGGATAVVSASENCAAVLDAAGLAERFDTRVDGQVTAREHLAGKPAPDTYLHAAHLLGVTPQRAAVVEDARAGVAAGAAGNFALVVGVARRTPPRDLYRDGADVVVTDLADLADLARCGDWPRAGGRTGDRATGHRPADDNATGHRPADDGAGAS